MTGSDFAELGAWAAGLRRMPTLEQVQARYPGRSRATHYRLLAEARKARERRKAPVSPPKHLPANVRRLMDALRVNEAEARTWLAMGCGR